MSSVCHVCYVASFTSIAFELCATQHSQLVGYISCVKSFSSLFDKVFYGYLDLVEVETLQAYCCHLTCVETCKGQSLSFYFLTTWQAFSSF